MKAKVWYLYNSGFAVDTGKRLLVFDYYLDRPRGAGLDGGVVGPEELAGRGVVGPEELAGRGVVVFASHRHSDHFNPVILEWKKRAPDVRYVLSDDIPAVPGAEMLRPGALYDGGDFTVRALDSTDEGAAFLVKADGLCVYHAGDLNWWHWNGETEAYNAAMAEQYRGQVDLLRGERIDLAFVPVDPRLEDKALWGLDYFMRAVGARHVFPMHFGRDDSIFARLREDPAAEPYRGRIVPLARRGQSWELPDGEG